MVGRTVRARYCCPACGGKGRWFLVEEGRAPAAIARRLEQHGQRCTGVKDEPRRKAA